MSTESKPSSKMPTAGQQRQQANILLLRLQWLIILLLIIALAWLYVSQQRFQNQVNERFKSKELVTTRLNEMDDRLFAISQQALPTASTPIGNQAQNQLSLLRIQLQATDSLLVNNDYKAAIDLLRGLQWQLSQNANEIAPALTVVIKQSLSEDIEHLQAQSAQPSSWQLQNLAIQNIQEFLHSYEGGTRQNASNSTKSVNNNKAVQTPSNLLTRQQLTIHEVIMTLNLAIQASNMREQDQLANYLLQSRTQLQTLTGKVATSQQSTKLSLPAIAKTKSAEDNPVDLSETDGLDSMVTPTNIAEVIVWLDKLLANAPTPTPLVTAQILQQPKGRNDK